jgi:hypothetical protein
MDAELQAAFNTVLDWAGDNGYEIFAEQVCYVMENNGGQRA